MTLALILGIPGAVLAVVTLIGLVWRYGTTVKTHLSRQPWAKFDERRFSLSSTGFQATQFALASKAAGVEAPAMAGAITRGESLIVRLQAVEVSPKGLGVWLTVENDRGQRALRWFGPEVTVYPTYEVLRPALSAGGSHMIFNLYPGQQNTCYYFFEFRNDTSGPKFMVCKSWDKDLSFWWARGA